MKAVDVKIQLVDGGIMPKQATEGSAGLDLFACISEKEDVYIEGIDQKNYLFSFKGELDESTFEVTPKEVPFMILPPNVPMIVSAGFKVELPEGYEMQIRPRSGVSFKSNLRIANSPGTIDSDYRGNVGVIVENTGDTPIIIFHGDRIAQAVIQEVPKVTLAQVDDLSVTARDAGGFGSTGV